ncbi:MAG: ABC transporter substrate-binding protein [Phenylobacterium sp.]|uniref:ABC transporter substrate-binding protein n=1 Tax=Phenylobacterium sp. TaxID=1871053 RepID=UPI003919DAA9
MSWRITRRAALAAGGAAALGAAGSLAPLRVVSLNPCLDAILVRVADRGQIAAISHYSRDAATSSIAPMAARLPVVRQSAEEVLALRPDLVLAGRFGGPVAQAGLQRLDIRVELFPVPETVADSLAQVRQVAALVGRARRGDELVARIEAALAAAVPPPGARPLSALVFQSGGFASAEGTLIDEMLRRTGFANAAPRYGLSRSGAVPLELLIADPPDVLLAGRAQPGTPTWADRVLNHPALARMPHRMHRAEFPQRLMYCGGPVLIEAAAMLAKARQDTLEARG